MRQDARSADALARSSEPAIGDKRGSGRHTGELTPHLVDDHLERAFRGAGLLGTDVMTSSLEKPILDRVDERCRRYKVRLGLHNHYLGDAWFKGDKKANFEGPDDFLEALKGRSEYLSINLDVGHFWAALPFGRRRVRNVSAWRTSPLAGLVIVVALPTAPTVHLWFGLLRCGVHVDIRKLSFAGL